MKTTRKVTCALLMACMLFMFSGMMTVLAEEPQIITAQGTEASAAQAIKKGLVQTKDGFYYYSNGKKLKNTWKIVKGKKYYFQKDGKAATYSCSIKGKLYVFNKQGELQHPSKSSFVSVGKKMYYVDKKGIAATGWLVISKKLYYADSKGRICKDSTYHGVTFKASGAAKNSTSTKLHLKANSVVNSITKSSMSKPQKLRACWNYVTGGSFVYRIKYPNMVKGWQKKTALDMLNTHGGNCYSFACAFAALAAEIGYKPYIVCGRVSGNRDGAADGLTRHCWVRINGGNYDPEAQYKGWYRGVYGTSGYGITHTIQSVINFDESV